MDAHPASRILEPVAGRDLFRDCRVLSCASDVLDAHAAVDASGPGPVEHNPSGDG
jgi:hypothetical protein